MFVLLGALLLVTQVVATPHSHLDGFPWEKPTHDAGIRSSRGPCPILNTLANHGFIPRSGRNLSAEQITFGLSRGINVAKDIAIMASSNAVALNPANNASTFDLDMLSKHNVIEHDNSLTRADAFFGDQQTFNRTVLDQTLSYWPKEIITLTDAAAALTGRMRHSQTTNPKYKLDLFGSTSTTASYMAILGSSEKGEAVRAWVKFLFENEKLPVELGWTPRQPEYDIATLTSLSARVEKHLPKDVTESAGSSFREVHSQQVLSGS